MANGSSSTATGRNSWQSLITTESFGQIAEIALHGLPITFHFLQDLSVKHNYSMGKPPGRPPKPPRSWRETFVLGRISPGLRAARRDVGRSGNSVHRAPVRDFDVGFSASGG